MFTKFKTAVQKQFDRMKKHDLYRVELTKDRLWDTYLGSFPEGSNPVYRERTEHDCQCCKGFIRAVGGVVAIIDGKVESIWDIEVGGSYQVVADALAAVVKASPIADIFLHTERSAGVDKNHQYLESGRTLTWEHFYVQIPAERVVRGELLGTRLGEARTGCQVLQRSLSEITIEALDTVIELIAQKTLYRGDEHRYAVETFRKLKREYDKLSGAAAKDVFCWSKLKGIPGSVTGIRGTVIGTLLTDLSEGKDLEPSVGAYEAKVAPANYKRPTALVTKGMIDAARKTIEELGLTSALERRHATITDITINNILFADRQARQQMNVFDEMASQVPEKLKNLERVEEVAIENFIANILPGASSVELFLDNRHSGNLVSLVAPKHAEAKGMFKWGNNFSWSYAGELADSIKERVKRAGGKVDGDLRCSLSWFNHDDLDLHLIEPGGNRIYYGSRVSPATGGALDVDMNAGSGTSRTPVENICHADRRRMREGNYKLQVNQFCRRESRDMGFEVEIEFDGVIHSFAYAQGMRTGETVVVAEFRYTHKTGLELVRSLPSSQSTREIWGLQTQNFHRVSVMMLSPNHWDGMPVGNKHYIFVLDGCRNDGVPRGFFNEFLDESLNVHRKVLEIIGSKMKVEDSENQLSGLGFSSTQRNSVLCRVKGAFERTIKITF